MPIGWRPRDLEPYFNNGRIGYNKSQQTKFVSSPMVKSRIYLIAQMALGILFLFFTINLKMPLVYWHRILLSTGIFLMIISWGAILESKTWAIALEIFRNLFMAISLVFVLHSTGISTYENWTTIAISLVVGINITYFSVVVAKANKHMISKDNREQSNHSISAENE